MALEPTHKDLADEQAEDLSRFESEGGSTEPEPESDDEARTSDVQPLDSEDQARVLIVYAAEEQRTYMIVDAIAVRLRRHGFTVEVGDAFGGTMPPPQDYDAVILGLPMMFGRESDVIATYIEQNRGALSELPAALFTVSRSGPVHDHDPAVFLEPFLRKVAWRPDIAAAFAGGEPFPRDGVLLRLKEWLGASDVPQEAAAFRTNWTDVEHFADAIAIELASAAATARRSEGAGAIH